MFLSQSICILKRSPDASLIIGSHCCEGLIKKPPIYLYEASWFVKKSCSRHCIFRNPDKLSKWQLIFYLTWIAIYSNMCQLWTHILTRNETLAPISCNSMLNKPNSSMFKICYCDAYHGFENVEASVKSETWQLLPDIDWLVEININQMSSNALPLGTTRFSLHLPFDRANTNLTFSWGADGESETKQRYQTNRSGSGNVFAFSFLA